MSQQVNLYQPILRAQKRVFSSRTISMIVLGIAATMLLLWGANAWQRAVLAAQLEDARAQEQEMTAQVARLTRELKGQVVSETLKREVETLRSEVNLKQRLMQNLFASEDGQGGRFGNGFAAALEALGRNRIDGLWLTRIDLQAAGAEVRFAGNTREAALVPRMVELLGDAPPLETLSFRDIRVIQDPDGLRFELSTEAPEMEVGSR